MQTAESDRRPNLQGASRFRVSTTDSSLGSIDVLQYLLAALEVDFAALGQSDRPRRSGEQRHAELVFELGDRPGDDRGRKPQLSGGFGKTSQPCNRDVDAHGVETVHPPLLKQQQRLVNFPDYPPPRMIVGDGRRRPRWPVGSRFFRNRSETS